MSKQTVQYEIKNPLEKKSLAVKNAIFSILKDYTKRSDVQNQLALAYLPLCYGPEKSPFNLTRTLNDIHDFSCFYEDLETKNFFEKANSSFKRFVTRAYKTPFHNGDPSEENVLVIISLYIYSVYSSNHGQIIRDFPAFELLKLKHMFLDLEKIIVDTKNAKAYLSNEHMELMRSFSEVARKSFKIESMDSNFLLANLFKNGVKERNYLIYRLGTKISEIGSPYYVKTFLKLKADLDKTVRMIHFYKDPTNEMRRSNGAAIELMKSVYFLGGSSIQVSQGENEPFALSEAKGLKVIVTEQHLIAQSPTSFPVIVLSSNKDYRSLAARGIAIETTADSTGKINLGRVLSENLENERKLFIDQSVSIEKALLESNPNIALECIEP